jgi:phosphohistidine phosphatase SixA
VPASTVLNELRALQVEAESELVVGHQPAWSEAAVRLIGGGSLRMSTGSVACISLDVHGWGEIAPGRGELLWLVSPKILLARRWPAPRLPESGDGVAARR